MAVPEGKRTEAKMEVQTRAIELAIYTTTICNNNKIFPKRDRWIIANRIVGYALDIMDEVNYANDIYVSTKEDYTERRMAQVRAKSCTAKLLGLIDLAYSKYHIESKRMEHWTRLACFYKRWTNTTKMFGKDDFDVQKTIYKRAAAVRKRKKHAALEQAS